jgi:hypothetical protein
MTPIEMLTRLNEARMAPGLPPYVLALHAFNHRRSPGSYTWDQMLGWHLNLGFVFSTPDFFIAGRPVPSTAPARDLYDYARDFRADSPDVWYVAIAAGDLCKAWGILPYHLPLIGFDREGEVRFFDLERVRRLTQSNQH